MASTVVSPGLHLDLCFGLLLLIHVPAVEQAVNYILSQPDGMYLPVDARTTTHC
jgi:hypothetical protein